MRKGLLAPWRNKVRTGQTLPEPEFRGRVRGRFNGTQPREDSRRVPLAKAESGPRPMGKATPVYAGGGEVSGQQL